MANFVLIVVTALFFYFIFCVNIIVARDCLDMANMKNCDECIRCGGHWCNKPDKKGSHCSDVKYDSWCPSDRESLPSIERVTLKGMLLDPVYVEKTAFVHEINWIPINYPATVKPTVEISVINTTQSALVQHVDLTQHVNLSYSTDCSSGYCTSTVEAIPDTEFCLPNSRTGEYVTVKVSVENMTEDTFIKYHVPCACECSGVVEHNSEVCNNRGDLSCGVCTCHNGWAGAYCELKKKKECKSNRGDLECTNPAKNDVECSGNGFCDSCQTCECFTDREGSQYYDKENFCVDICMTTSDCDDCLRDPKPGNCEECQSPLTVMNSYNSSLMHLKDAFNRNVWVRCNKTLSDGCYVEYGAMRDEIGTVHMMVISLCPSIIAAVTGHVNLTIPIVLGVIGIIAAAATAAGFMMYKKSTPPLPLTDPQYQNIDAEDCVGENPLYKPPTSSFKNPTYGKW